MAISRLPGPSRPGNVTPPYSTSARKGIQDYLGGAVAVLHANGSDLAEASRLAGEADVVLVVAGSRHDEVGEYISDEQFFRPDGPEQKKPLTIKLPFMKEPFVMSGGDRVPLALKEHDLKVIEAAAKANKRCIVALVGAASSRWRSGRMTCPPS